MVKDALMAGLMSVAVFAGGLLLLAALFRTQVRRYNRVVATDVLNDWDARLRLLDAAERQRVLRSPPATVVAAMAGLPSRGPRSGWADRPVPYVEAAAPPERPAGSGAGPGIG